MLQSIPCGNEYSATLHHNGSHEMGASFHGTIHYKKSFTLIHKRNVVQRHSATTRGCSTLFRACRYTICNSHTETQYNEKVATSPSTKFLPKTKTRVQERGKIYEVGKVNHSTSYVALFCLPIGRIWRHPSSDWTIRNDTMTIRWTQTYFFLP